MAGSRAVPLLASSLIFRALRWRLILSEHPGARFSALTLAAGVGLGANAILPGKLGEAVAAHALGRLADLSRIQSLGIIVITRLVDLLVLFGLVLAASFILPSPALARVRVISIAVVAVSAVLLLIPLLQRPGRLAALWSAGRRLLTRVLGQSLADMAEKFARGMAAAGRPGLIGAFVLSTILLWGVLSTSFLLATRAFGINLPLVHAPLIMGLIAASAMLPAAPGNVGTFHYFGLLALGLVGVDASLAAACIVTYHALDLAVALAIGAACTAWSRRLVWRPPAPQTEVLKTRSLPGDKLAMTVQWAGVASTTAVSRNNAREHAAIPEEL